MKVGDKVIVDPRLHGCIWCNSCGRKLKEKL